MRDVPNDDDIELEPDEESGLKRKPPYEDDEVVVNENGKSDDTIKNLREKLRQALSEKQEYLDGWQRARADLVNARKKDEEDRTAFAKFATERMIEELMPVMESFDMAFSNTETWNAMPKNWTTGIEYIHNQLIEVLKNNGVTIIDPAGEKFDPRYHASTSSIPAESEADDHTVAKVLQRGYELHGKVLKPARVVIKELVK